MRFDRESWRKLYITESIEHRMMPVLARGLRDYLLRHAKQDGTLLAKTDSPADDLARGLGAHPDEFESVTGYITEWISNGFLVFSRGRLWIRNFEAAQASASPGAKRQKRYRERKRDVDPVTRDVTRDVTQRNGVTKRDVTRDVTVTSHPTRPDPPDKNHPSIPVGSSSVLSGHTREATLPDQPQDKFGQSFGTKVGSWSGVKAEHREQAKAASLDVDAECDKFRAHYEHKGTVGCAWDSQFKSWLIRAMQYEKQGKGNGKARSLGRADDTMSALIKRTQRIIAEEEAEKAAGGT